MLQKVHFLSFCSIFLRKRTLFSIFFCIFVAKSIKQRFFKRKRTKMIEPI